MGRVKGSQPLIILAIMAALLIAAVLAWSLRSDAPAAPRAAQNAAATASIPNQPERLKVKVLVARHHDPAAFTQGLLVHGGSL